MKWINIPSYVPETDYRSAIARMVERLSTWEGLIAIYQIGHVGTPGISDIDLVVVFEDEAACSTNPRSDLSASEQYLFIHALYGVHRNHFMEGQQCTFFHNYHHLWGEKLIVDDGLAPEQEGILKVQIALEYLLNVYISNTIQSTYGILKLRGVLLHTKGLAYDLDFLGVVSGPLYDAVETLIAWRSVWFSNPPTRKAILEWYTTITRELHIFLKEALLAHNLYLPARSDYRIAKNIKIRHAEALSYLHRGIPLPAFFAGLNKKYFNVQHRFNGFEFHVPFQNEHAPNVLQRKFNFQKNMLLDNQKMLPHFMSLQSSLHFR